MYMNWGQRGMAVGTGPHGVAKIWKERINDIMKNKLMVKNLKISWWKEVEMGQSSRLTRNIMSFI